VTATSLESPASDLVSIAVSGSSSLIRLTAAGEVDSSTAPLLRKHIDAILDGDVVELTIDLDGVTFLDSAGLCVLASAHRRAVERAVQMRVLASSRAVVRPLQITGLWDLLGVQQVAPGTGSAV
jgi:anti-sigma B factor antagonist